MALKADAFLLVDAQVDFFPGGALPVPGADAILPAVNALLAACRVQRIPVVASRDWHPADHASFIPQGGPWPPHCVRGTGGADFHPDLDLPPVLTLVDKATARDRDAYSAFEGTELANELRDRGIGSLLVAGLALDYCVEATCRDAVREGFEVRVVLPATRAVDLHPGDAERAVEELRTAGVAVLDEVPR
ncbi:MAG TPA: isochorismatase family protein [Acidobacteria bacterium]|nr:isochorismatase family protein [Acidobacteriota bacterium]